MQNSNDISTIISIIVFVNLFVMFVFIDQTGIDEKGKCEVQTKFVTERYELLEAPVLLIDEHSLWADVKIVIHGGYIVERLKMRDYAVEFTYINDNEAPYMTTSHKVITYLNPDIPENWKYDNIVFYVNRGSLDPFIRVDKYVCPYDNDNRDGTTEL